MTVTVTIGGSDYDALANQGTADTYLAADSLYAALWAALTEDDKGRALVSAYRRFLRLPWADDTLPEAEQDVIDASILLAAQISQDAAVATGAGTGSNTRRVKAGSAEVEFFKPQKGALFTADVMAMIRPFLATTTSAGEAIGGSDETIYGNPWDRNEGFA